MITRKTSPAVQALEKRAEELTTELEAVGQQLFDLVQPTEEEINMEALMCYEDAKDLVHDLLEDNVFLITLVLDARETLEEEEAENASD